MTKFYASKIFLSILLCSLVTTVYGQNNQTNVAFLNENAIIVQKRMSANKEQAYALARQKGWDTFRISKNGAVMSLQGVDDFGIPQYYVTENNTTAAATTSADKLYAGGGLGLTLSGSTIPIGKIAIWDGGAVLVSHVEFAPNRVEVKDGTVATSSHSTHVAGTIAAAGVYPAARGMAFGLPKLYSFDFNSDVAEMSANAANLLLSNHSYGSIAGWRYNSDLSTPRWEYWGTVGSVEDYKFGYYSADAQAWDLICYNAPYYLPVKSAGNNRGETGPAIGSAYYRFDAGGSMVAAGNRPGGISSNDSYDIIATASVAKNIMTVGAIYPLPFGPTPSSIIQIAPFSSFGPTDDGRIKPDIVGDGVDLTSTSDAAIDAYAISSGTSMSSPNVTGSLALLQELYAQKNGGTFMRAATLKGLAIATATEAGVAPGPDYIFGWGLLNTEEAAKSILANGTKSMISERTLGQGSTDIINVIASGNGPLVATICWTDPEATAVSVATALDNPILRLVNDLDLRGSQGAVNYSPWVLDPANPSAAATTGDNFRDNVEQVYIKDAVPGKSYTFKISHKGTLVRGPQTFSIIINGIGGTTYCTSAPSSSADSKITSLKLSTVDYTAPASCTTYTDLTAQTIDLEKGKTYPLALSLGTCGANFDKVAKVFVDWNGDGDFTDSDELVATSAVINATGTLNANIVVPGGIVANTFSLLRVVLTETSTAANVTPCNAFTKGETLDVRVKFLNTAIDAGVKSIVSPITGDCSNLTQNVTVRLRNYGIQNLTSVPVTVTVAESGNTIATLTGTFTGNLSTGTETNFILPTTFNAVAGKTYTLTAKTTLGTDLILFNDEGAGTATIALAPVAVAATSAAYLCTSSNMYNLKAATAANEVAYWYKNTTVTDPIAFGSLTQTTTPPDAAGYYLGINDFKADLGYSLKNQINGGAYSSFLAKISVSTLAPMVIESAKFYVGASGTVKISVTSSSGVEVSSTTISVTATGTTPGDINTDLGKVYPLNLSFPAAGSYTISFTFADGATLYRNGVSGANIPYPITTALNLFSIDKNNGDPVNFSNFWYYFYALKVKAMSCSSTTRAIIPLATPIITQNGTALVSSVATGVQWYLNGTLITGATTATYTPNVSGKYTVEATLATGCTSRSAEFNFSLSGTVDETAINLKIYPTPVKTDVTFAFDVKAKNEVSLKITNILGQVKHIESKSNFIGKYTSSLNLSKWADGTYVVNIQIGTESYSRKFIVGH